jgi:mannonate dehydratase
MVYVPEQFDPSGQRGVLAPVTQEQIWARYRAFLADLLPVAEQAGVTLAIHPDDPSLPTLRGMVRVVHGPDSYQQVLDLSPSRFYAMEFCIGTLSEMPDADIYDLVERYSSTGRIAYVHFRNVRGKAPHYHETFIDDGDTDMIRVLRILKKHGFDGVLIPDHTPLLECAAPWHAGMAYAPGYMRAALRMLAE